MPGAYIRGLPRVGLVALYGLAGAACGSDRVRIESGLVQEAAEPDDAGSAAEPVAVSVPSVDAGRDASAPTQIVWQRISEGLEGLTWTGEPLNFARGLSGVAYGNGIWVALGETQGQDNALRWATSSDGVHWTPASQALPEETHSSVFNLFFAQGRFVLFDRRDDFTGDPRVFIYTSPDAVSWSAREMPSGVLGGFGMTSDGRRTVGALGGGNLWDSTDLARWSRRKLAEDGESAGAIDVAFGDGRWVASMGVSRIEDSGYQEDGRLFTSAEGQSWQRVAARGQARFQVEYGNGVWLALNGVDEHLVSRDGVAFEAIEPTGAWRTGQRPWVRFVGDRFVSSYIEYEPNSFELRLVSSADGVAWSDFGSFPGIPVPEGALDVEYWISDVAYADCRYVVAGSYTIHIPGAIDPPLFVGEAGPLLLTTEVCPPAR